jgi:hypothetical protein
MNADLLILAACVAVLCVALFVIWLVEYLMTRPVGGGPFVTHSDHLWQCERCRQWFGWGEGGGHPCASAATRIQVVVGRCPTCGATTESAEGLAGLKCARGHQPTAYDPQDTYYEDEAKTWEESA